MCLSTVYKETQEPENILMKNVMTIECHPQEVVLTDLMGRKMTIPGILRQANLVDGYALVEEADEAV
ncbi:CooT family nickel-binding protein [Chordicoccus furentiruminis]|jgi:predicted RNA-binding protein|uniref:CooT family nickel-binding protein n=1 Tax=Chordicoccus furentiruminis TaxID=2709410 RepID=UPI0023A87583|nr:CooT family nickel-binding protein [Chordicoccus furentiruminis]